MQRPYFLLGFSPCSPNTSFACFAYLSCFSYSVALDFRISFRWLSLIFSALCNVALSSPCANFKKMLSRSPAFLLLLLILCFHFPASNVPILSSYPLHALSRRSSLIPFSTAFHFINVPLQFCTLFSPPNFASFKTLLQLTDLLYIVQSKLVSRI